MGVLAMPTSFILGVVVGSLMIQTISTYVIDEVVNDNEGLKNIFQINIFSYLI